MRKPWQTKEWREKRLDFIKGKVCEWCGSEELLTIHHPQLAHSLTYEEYISFKGTMILCRKCAFAYHKGLDLCPICKQRYKKRRFPSCFSCSGNGISVTTPCGRKQVITKLAFEVMGIFEVCHECDEIQNCKKVGGT